MRSWITFRTLPAGFPARDMGVSVLPDLVLPSRLPSSAAQRTYLAFILFEFYRIGGPVELSRRSGQKLFNRAGGPRVSQDLKALRDAGWLNVTQSPVSEAYIYSPGRLLTRNPKLFEEWEVFSKAMFGRQGLVSKFKNSAVWGHGFFGWNQVLVLGMLVYRKQSFRRVDVINYLAGLVGTSSIDTALKTLTEAKILQKVDGKYTRTVDWKNRLRILVDGHPGGRARRHRIAKEVRKERHAYTMVARLGHLTLQEKKSLLKNPCLQCGEKAVEVEHFPPQKLGGKDHPHLVWASCKKHNKETRWFIRKLKPLPPLSSCLLVVKKDFDVNFLLRTTLVRHLRNFYRAAEAKDYTAGHEAVRKSVQFLSDLETLGLLRNAPKAWTRRRNGARSFKGRQKVVQESSRMKYSR